MMGIDKKLAYDWIGVNEWLFRQINGLDGNPTYNSFMVFLSSLAEHTNFPYFFAAMAVYAVVDFLVRKASKKGGGGKSVVMWIGILSVFAASYAVDGITIKLLKEHFSYPRPYAALGSVNLLGQPKPDDAYHSFPSGHAAFITVLVCSLWPALSGKMPLVGAFLILMVCWSRIAMGMHFPADVLGGFFISFFVVLAVRFFLYSLFARLFKWKC